MRIRPPYLAFPQVSIFLCFGDPNCEKPHLQQSLRDSLGWGENRAPETADAVSSTADGLDLTRFTLW